MGTETIKNLDGHLVITDDKVKLNNPLMGTEAVNSLNLYTFCMV